MGTNASLAAEARAALARRSMTQTELARTTGRSRPYWQSRLAGRVPMTVDDLDAISRATGTPLSTLLDPIGRAS